METLKSKGERYIVDGRHSTVFSVQLPPWIDEDVARELVSAFEVHLWQELLTLHSQKSRVLKDGLSHVSEPSEDNDNQSHAGLSAPSNASSSLGGCVDAFLEDLQRAAISDNQSDTIEPNDITPGLAHHY
jgi:hypothetical protein